VTIDKTVPQIKAFIEAGGTVMTIGSSTALARHLGLPLENAIVDNSGRPLVRDRFYVPGSVLRAKLDTSKPLAHGMGEYADFFFDESPAFKLGADAAAKNLRAVAWYDSKTPLRSGWAWGQKYLNGGVAAAEAIVGKGRVYVFGPEILQRAQPHGTFKLLFNAIVESAMPIHQHQ
jgi:hypothetical protein